MKNVEDIYRLSPMQQGMLFHTLGAPGAGTYVEQVYWTWRGALDLPTLQRAWQRLVERHTPLRTAFFWENMKEPLQAVRRKVAVAPRVEDWSEVPAEAREARFAELLEREQRQDFTLSTAPLVRFTVVRLGPALARCIVSYHHLVMDGWSLPVCLRELFLTYDALARGEEPALEPARLYRDYIVWLSKQERAEAERFWRERLRGFTTATPLAADRPAEPGAKVEAYTSESLGLGTALTARLTAFTRQHQVTLSTLVQGAWALLLGRYSGQDDVAFGTVVSGRPAGLPGVDTMLGTFINTQVSRVDLPAGGTVLPWLKSVHAELLAARSFEHVSLVDVQGWSEVPRGQPLFDSLVVFENLPRRGLSPETTARLPVEGFARTDARTGYPLIFVVLPDATEVELRFTYDVARFDAATARRMLGHVATLLRSLVDAPEAKLADLSMVSPDEARRLTEWNDTRVEYPRGDSLHSLFEAQVRRTPDAEAVRFEDESLTYAQLDARANQLARHLRSLGVGAESLVGVCLERSLEMVVALLGTLKAGAAYVPLDPGYPQERLAFMLADSAPRVLLCQQHLLERLPPSSVPVLCLDSQWPVVAGQPASAPELPVQPRGLAYVIYTSGSTGRPKGAMNEHGAVCNRLHWMQQAYGLGPADTVLQKTPFSFDVSVWEFFWPLMTGARLVLARPGGHQEPTYLADLISRRRVTTLHFVPSMLRAFLEEPGLEAACASVRRIVCSGEALPAELARRCLERLPEAGLHNLYGPTEAAVDVTAWTCRRGDARASVPIGRPIANTSIHLLDAALRPVPVGVPGELFIAGVQVGRGYLARPELTAERFIPDPFSDVPGARLYRTGDLARWLPDGTVDYLGRLDFQVKVRGLRIELGEIEAALVARPSVKQAVVVAREDVPGHQRLVAYVVPREGGAVDVNELRQELLRGLPEYMVPSAFVALEALPLSPNGKLDRKALPVPDADGLGLEREYVAPRDAREQALADIWAQVLGRPRVGIHDNFFELGGDSIISLQVIARARQAGMRLTPHHVFQHRTVAELARVAEAEQPTRGAEGPVQGPVPLTPIQRFFLEQPLPRPHHFNQAVLLEVREPLDASLLEWALRHLVDHHDALRMRLSSASGRWEQHNAPPGAVLVLKRVDLSPVPAAGQAAALEAEANGVQASLDLSEGLLLRAAFFERGSGRTARLLLVAHHLVVDGVSWRVLMEDLETACEQLRRGGAVALPPRSTSFQTWARRLEALARTEALEEELPVWLERLQAPTVALPVDGPGMGGARSSTSVVTVELDAEQTRLLLREMPTAYHSRLDEVLLSALAQVLVRWTGPGALRVALEGHGREALFDGVDVSRTVGWFTSLYPVRLEVPAGATPGEALRSVRESLRALPRQGVGYGLLRSLGRDEVAAKLAALPEPEVAFNYLGQVDAQSSTLFALSAEPSGTSRDPGGSRRYALEVDAMVVGGRLRVSWTHGEHLHTRATIESLARQHLEALRAVVAGRASPDVLRYTPSDFPLVGLDAATLERLFPTGTAVEDVYPLSPLQQGLLFHALLSPGEGMYFEQLSWAIRSPVDAAALRRAWEAVVAHDAMLRTRFAWEGLTEPVQVVHPKVALPWTELDWRDVPEAEQPARLEAFLKDDRGRPFELGKAPLMRVALIRLGESAWHCAWSFHHLLLDGWSMGRVLQQLFTAYAALCRGQAPRLEPVPSHRGYVAWLRKQDLARSESWWRQTLEGFTAPTPLPAVRAVSTSAEAAAEGHELALRLPAATTSALQAFARRHELTLNTLTQAAWALVLQRHGGEEDVVFGVTVSGRPAELPGVEEMVGLFINSLPARVRVEPGAEVVPWLRRLQAQQVELRQHEHCPLVQVQAWSQVPRGTPLFDSLFVFENYPVDSALRERSLGVTVTDVRMRERTNYPLLLAVVPGAELELQLAYDSARHDEATASLLLGHVRLALEGLAANESRRLGDVTLLSPEERQRVLVTWNDTGRDTREGLVHALFEAQAARTPDASALTDGSTHFTYRELNGRANQLARRLRETGVGSEVIVGLCLERSPEAVIALLAVLKAGGAWLPLDPSYPPQRLTLMLADSGATLLLTRGATASLFPSVSARVLDLDAELKLAAAEEVEDLPSLNDPSHLAYVLYTSGTTGRPKGTLIAHRSLANHAAWMGATYGLGARDRQLQLASLSFDASVAEVFSTLLSGATLVLAPPDAHRDPAALAQVLVRERITVMQGVPSLLRVLLDDGALAGATHLRWLLSGGEALPAGLVSGLRAALPHTRLSNNYGPTETTIDATCLLVERESHGGVVSIGRPVANAQVYVLDAGLRPVPVGVPGELYVGGLGLARGYLGQPGLTAERFVPHPFATTPGERLYQTGDKVCWSADGTLEYLGRIDFQVKLRGFRIEPGEVEAALRTHSIVAEAVALVREDGRVGPRLVAYVVPMTGAVIDTAELRASLAKRLPEYMVPAVTVVLPALPLAPNGKLDREALPVPDAPVDTGTAYVAPRTPTEELLAGLFAQVLGVERVGATDSFFDLGGHSLLATQVVSRVRGTAGVDLPLRDLFESPTVAGLAARVDALARSSEGTALAPPLRPAPRTGPLPLSFAQQRLWFLDRLEPGSPFYNTPGVLWLEGTLDVGALERSLAELVRRHEVLRTTFAEGPVQVIHPASPVPLPLVDLTSLPEGTREAEARRLAREEAQRPFDLTRGPLLRTTLLRLSESRHVLLLTLHHIVTDGWSMGVLVRESAALYAAFREGRASPLPELSVQYADYAAWQRGWLQGDALEAQLSWWREHLAGAPPVLELPTDFPRPAVQGFRGATHTRVLPRELADSLQALSRREGTTLFMALLAGFEVVLSRYSGQEDFVVGTDIANRNRAETEGLIGFFINQLALRTKLEGDPTFRELLGRVRQATLGAYAHQDLPFEELVKALNPERSLGHAPLFQVKLVLQNQPDPALEAPGLTLRGEGVDAGTSRLDLTLSILETARGLECTCEYRTDLFEAATIDRLVLHLGTVLEAAAARPESHLSALPLLSEGEQRRVLVEWNATGHDFPRDASAHQLFEAQAARTPDAVAARFEGEALTYARLDARANRLAHHLRSLGVRAEVPVALCVERSLDMVVAILGILKAGGAYVPMDPSYPVERLTYMLRDCAAPVLVTTEAIADELPSGSEQLVLLDAEADLIATRPDTAPEVRVFAESLAYIIYTSGSTGRPKGTLLQHRGLCNTALTAVRAHGFRPDSRVLQYAAFGFDASVAEIFGALLAGATLVLAPRERLMPGAPLRSLLREESITAVTLTPSVLAQLAPEDFPSLETLISAGEACTPELVERWGGRVRLLNAYGPTEVTVCATLSEPMKPGHRLTIGKPWSNVRVYVVDAALRPLPVGVPGELCVDSVGLARGYHQQAGLTAERFIPNPFSDVPGARLYRTGDRVRWLADGTLEYLGRIDLQVKLRGFRIELGEVESALAQHPSVREAVATVREDAPGDKRLVAYVVAEAGEALDTTALRASLKQRLPEHMVPAVISVLDALPLTSNGKVDRKALPSPDTGRTEQAREYVAPRTPMEEQLAALWAELLHVPRVGIHDDFFELGGHSLLATQLTTRLRDAFGVELPLRELFEAPTLAVFAPRVEQATRGLARAGPRPVPREGPLPLSFAQQRLWFLDQLIPGDTQYNLPSALRFKGALDVQALERAFEALVLRHESLRTTFQATGEGAVQVIHPAAALPLTRVDLGDLPEERREAEAPRLAGEEALRPFDLGHGPLMRATLLRLGAEDHVLLVTTHHIVSDAWSVGVLIREVGALYGALATGAWPQLPPLPIQYADHAVWQRGWLKDEALESQLSYWRHQLSGAPHALELPTDRPRPAVQTHRGAAVHLRLPRELHEALEALGQREGATPFMVMLAAWQWVLSRHSGQEDLCVGSPIAGRTRAETEGLIGFFVNTLVLRTRLSGADTFRALLARVREVALGAYAHQDVPFEKLVEELKPERDLSRTPLFQVMLSLQNTPRQELKLPGLTARPFGEPEEVARFDLLLNFDPEPDGLLGTLVYNADLFDADTATRLLGHLHALLRAVAARPEQPLADLSLMSEEERQQVLVTWNATARGYDAVCIHQQFEAQVLRTPEAPALSFGDERLTYRQLHQRVLRLSARLRALGVRPDAPVGLCVHRSPDMVAGMLAILHAGGAYLPLDPGYPAERLAYMLQDSGASVLVTQRHLAGLLPTDGVQVLTLDEALDGEPATAPAAPGAARAESLAYVIYTSGSTGRPKGVMVPHATAANFFVAMEALPGLGSPGTWLAVTSSSFDISVLELLWTLARGFHVVLHDEQAASRTGTALSLPEVLRRHPITHLQCTPSFARTLVLAPESISALGTLRHLLVGGEALPGPLATQLREALPAVALTNMYGPTETTVWSSTHAVTEAEPPATVSIGSPIANTRMYVLDTRGQPTMPGAPGELYIAGDGVVRGYLGRPELTAERFVPDPFSGVPGGRMYRTGDLARWRKDGTLEFLGRADFQVKLRGFRIELGEVEAALLSFAGVREAAALVREDAPGDARLLGYVAADAGLDVEALRAHLQRRLPEHMVPSALPRLESLPLTANGKLDRRALLALEAPASRREYVAPRDELEQQVADLWAEVLRVERVGVHDSFFDLGGHSLLATQLLTRVRSTFQVRLPVRGLFEQPTVEGMTLLLLETLAESVDASELDQMVDSLDSSEGAS